MLEVITFSWFTSSFLDLLRSKFGTEPTPGRVTLLGPMRGWELLRDMDGLDTRLSFSSCWIVTEWRNYISTISN